MDMKDAILIYDDNCPLCSWYSSLFVRFGFLPASGRQPFSAIDPLLVNRIDIDRSKNEIPLIDTSTGKVWYGIDALLEILGQKFSLIKTTGNIKPVNWVLKRMYKFISYNRKVIVAKRCGPGSIDCSPDLNYFYRLLFMFLFLVFNTLLLFPIHDKLLSQLSWFRLSATELQTGHFIFALLNCTLALYFKKEKAIEYLGQVNMLALITILLLLPLLLLVQLFNIPEWLMVAYMAVVTIIIFKEYLRRMYYAGVLINNKWIVSINLACLMAFILFVFH
jgi:predicted DCC family thiol-disulfide oxidoreductase YuxK